MFIKTPKALLEKIGGQQKLFVRYAYPVKDALREKFYKYDATNKEWYRLYDLNYPDHREWLTHEAHFLKSMNVEIDETIKHELIENIES